MGFSGGDVTLRACFGNFGHLWLDMGRFVIEEVWGECGLGGLVWLGGCWLEVCKVGAGKISQNPAGVRQGGLKF